VDVDENKWTTIVTFRPLSMLMNPNDLSDASGFTLDVDENKWLISFCGNLSSAPIDGYQTSGV
jgi:hypothetical protein